MPDWGFGCFHLVYQNAYFELLNQPEIITKDFSSFKLCAHVAMTAQYDLATARVTIGYQKWLLKANEWY